MQAVILNGARAGESPVDGVHETLARALKDRGWQATSLRLRDIPIAYCQGCFECWVKTPGLCKMADGGRDVARSMINADLAVLLTSITFGGYSSELKKALDRTICLVSPFFMRLGGEVYHRRRYAKYPALLGVGVLPEAAPEDERSFTTLVSRNAINFHAPLYASGVIYTNQTAEAAREYLDDLLEQVVA